MHHKFLSFHVNIEIEFMVHFANRIFMMQFCRYIVKVYFLVLNRHAIFFTRLWLRNARSAALKKLEPFFVAPSVEMTYIDDQTLHWTKRKLMVLSFHNAILVCNQMNHFHFEIIWIVVIKFRTGINFISAFAFDWVAITDWDRSISSAVKISIFQPLIEGDYVIFLSSKISLIIMLYHVFVSVEVICNDLRANCFDRMLGRS